MQKKEKARTGLHLEVDQVDEILDGLDNGQSSRQARSGRGVRANRRIYDLKIGLTQPGGLRTQIIVVTRNLASRGVSFLHRNYLHTGSRFDAELPSLDGTKVIHVKGVVVRCRHVVNMIHEVSIRFDEPIDLPHFAALSEAEAQQCWTEIEHRRALTGRKGQDLGKALVVDDAKSQRVLGREALQGMGFKVLEAATGAETLKMVAENPIDLVLISVMLDKENGLEVCRALRQATFFGLIIMVTPDTDSVLRRKGLTMGCDTFVVKPVTDRNLQEAIAAATGEQSAMLRKPVQSSLDQDERVRPLIFDWVEQLSSTIDQLAMALTSNHTMAIRDICKTLKSDGGALGFWQITQAADGAMAALTTGAKLQDAQRQVNQLLQLLRRVTVTGVKDAVKP